MGKLMCRNEQNAFKLKKKGDIPFNIEWKTKVVNNI